MGGIEPATSFMLTAMEHGKGVVTANKAAVAAAFAKLHETAKANNIPFKFEASVGGGIPALTAIQEALAGNEFTEVMGILNGTTKYILTKMTDLGLDYNDVLKDAQEKGFAEADPTADVEGIDVANKLSILMALAFDHYVPPTEIPTVGISKITMGDIEAARAKNCKIKLIAHAKCEDGKIEYSVKPMEIDNAHPLAGVSNEFNAIYVTGNAVDEVMFYGKGAGALPTGSAIVGDVLAIAKAL
jgi:homoserine dehydrogenase